MYAFSILVSKFRFLISVYLCLRPYTFISRYESLYIAVIKISQQHWFGHVLECCAYKMSEPV